MVRWHSEALFTPDAGVSPWVRKLLGKVRAGTLAQLSSVITRKVGTRTFARIGGVWFDTALTKTDRIRLVAQASPAAQALRDARPELKPCFALGAWVIVSLGGGLAVSLDEVGLADPKNPRFRALLQPPAAGQPKLPPKATGPKTQAK